MKGDLKPLEISTFLGLTPSHVHERGDPRVGDSGRRYSDYSEGLWELRSTLNESAPLDEHLRALLLILRDRGSLLQDLRASGHVLDIFAGVFAEGGNATVTLDAGLLRELGELGLSVVFDVYTGSEGGEE